MGDPEDPKVKGKRAVICGYGPSLTSKEVPNKISEIRDVLFTVSGAYEYLKARGVVADYHVESDYREHKVNYLEKCDRKTTFLIESSVCDNYFRKVLEDVGAENIIQWDISYEPWYVHPKGTSTFAPLGNIGAHCLALAYFMGYRELHLFGLDGNFFPDGRRHAGQTHLPPFGSREDDIVVYANDKAFRTSAPFCLYVKQYPELVSLFQGAHIKVYGNTLLSNYLMDVRNAVAKQQQQEQSAAAKDNA